MSRRARSAELPPVEYDGGVHLPGTLLWFDPNRRRDLCFLSSALADSPRSHGQVVTTAETAALVGLRAGEALVARTERPFVLGKLKLELFASGFVLGAAQVQIQHAGARVVYAGFINPTPRPVAAPLVQPAAAVLVLGARYGAPRDRFPPREALFERARAFAREALAKGRTPVFLAQPLGTAQELALVLADAGIPVAASLRIAALAEASRTLGLALPPIRKFRGRLRAGEALLWPANGPLPRGLSAHSARLLVCSGRALDADFVRKTGADEGLALSNHADAAQLVEYVAASGAARVHLFGPAAEPLAAELRRAGHDASAFGTARQLELF